MAKVITFTNQKGGVGKTTSSSALISGLAMRGYKVLGIDLDPQGNLGFYFGNRHREPHFHLRRIQGPE